MLFVWWDQRGVINDELLKPGETVNTKRYQQQLTNLNHSPLEERPERGRTETDNTKSFFFMTLLHHIITYGKTGSRQVGSTQLGSSTLFRLLTRLGTFRLPFVRVDGSRTCWAALWFIRRSEKNDWINSSQQKGWSLLAWYSQIAQKMGKCVTNDRAYFE